MTIFDFRVRPPYKGFMDTILYQPESAPVKLFTDRIGLDYPESARQKSMDMMFQEMDDAGIVKGLLVGRESGVYGSVSNTDLAELVNAHPDRFVAAASIDTTDRRACIAQIDKALGDGLIAVNFEPGNATVPLYTDDRRLYPIYAYCEDKEIPVLIQAGGLAGPDCTYTAPHLIEHVCTDFPTLKVVAVHGGWPWVNEIIHVAWRRPNLYLSPDVYLCGQSGMDEYVRAANGTLSDRFLFATTYPLAGFAQYQRFIDELPLDASAKERFFYQNAEEVLGIKVA